MLDVRNVSAGYGKDNVLDAVSLRAHAGEITTVIGKNGCGKSTLLKTIAGIVRPLSGEVTVDGADMLHLSSVERARCIAYLAQGRGAPEITVGRMVLHGRFPHLGYPRRYTKADHAIAQEVMKTVGIDHLTHLPLRQLSGGMRQKVYIAMALAQQTPVVLMDEPTTYLDIAQQMNFGVMAQELAAQGKAVLLVLHDLLLALRISHRIVVMDGGRVLFSGTPRETMDSGILQQLYGVEVASLETEQGQRLYYNY